MHETLCQPVSSGYAEPMNDVDLNLLIALDVLLQEGSVTAAAKRLNLSASAMSRTLKRLRETTGDPLLVRAGRGLVPTPHAIALRERVHAVARDAKGLLQPANETLNVAALSRTFTLRANAAFIKRFSVPLVTAVSNAAPEVKLRFLPKPTKAIAPLRDGQLDLEIGVVETTAPELIMRGLFRDRFVGVARQGHPLLEDEITPERLAVCRQVMASPSGEFTGPMGETLSALGMAPKFGVIVPEFTDALRITAHTDFVTIVPRSCVMAIPLEVDRQPLERFELPLSEKTFMISALWHPRLGADLSHRWFREIVIETCRTAYSSGI